MGNNVKDILILGGGLSSLGAAWQLNRRIPKAKIRIIEKLSYVGGLAATPILENKYYLDIGPHFVTVETKKLMRLIRSLIGDNLLKMNRHCLLYFNGRHVNYPPSPKNILFELGFKTAVLGSLSYIKGKLFPPKKFKNFEDWNRYNFGDYMYKIFFKPYTEDFWGMKCSDLASKWADARISKMSFTKTILNTFFKTIKNTSINRDKLPMYYPKKGIGGISKKIAQKLKDNGVEISLKTKVKKIKILDSKNKKGNKNFEVTYIENGKKRIHKSDMLLSTIPITEFVEIAEPSPPPSIISASNKLRFRSLIIMYIITKKKNILGAPYVYYCGRSYHRLTESAKISKDLCPEGENMICVEKSCFVEENAWKQSKEELFDLFIKDLEKDKILKRKDVLKTFMFKEEHVYPVYARDFDKPLNVIKKYLKNINNFKYLGRPGAFLYLDMDQSLERSFKIADELLNEYKTF